ncbi:hypothetical protein C1H46_022973 [Malus baccata]|uniref:J domain-containing protein n=1 Tax=Malus baccata TaxID=106549 RepID=A0A540LYF6_MALBA|nr:hypothetical protein C1H46_022973 [Malus baccata]
MRNNDFTGTSKMAQKAQRLFPWLECIEKLHTVHSKIRRDDVTIKKQYEKLALLLHPDKNTFAGAEAAFKLIREAISVADQAKRSTYDMKRRAHVKTGSSPSAHPTNGNLFVRKQNNTPQSQFPPDTFWTHCPWWSSRICREYQLPNQKEPKSQGTSNAAPQSNGGTGKPSSARFNNGKAASNPAPKVGVAADVKMSKSGPVKSKGSKTSGNMNKKRGREPVKVSYKKEQPNKYVKTEKSLTHCVPSSNSPHFLNVD